MNIDESACDARISGKNCPANSWCCLDAESQKSVCVPCQRTLFGRCVEWESTTCARQGLAPWNELTQHKLDMYDVASKAVVDVLKLK